MDGVCGKCKIPMETDEPVRSTISCGSCSVKFHTSCINLSENHIAFKIASDNIRWMCDMCSNGLSSKPRADSKAIAIGEKMIKNIRSSPSTLSGNSYAQLLKNKKFIIPCVLVVLVLLVLAIVLVIETAADSKSKNVPENSEKSTKDIPINSTIGTISNPQNPDVIEDAECVGGKLCLVERNRWKAHAQTGELDPQTLPLHRVIIAHTASAACDSLLSCSDRLRVIQEFHMQSFGWSDIAYNFLISSDGRVYVGRGWDYEGAHTKGYNRDSVGIAFIGTFTTTKPTETQLNACRLLLEEGVALKKLVPSYKLYGERQLRATEGPGDALYGIIKNWDHWSPNKDI